MITNWASIISLILGDLWMWQLSIMMTEIDAGKGCIDWAPLWWSLQTERYWMNPLQYWHIICQKKRFDDDLGWLWWIDRHKVLLQREGYEAQKFQWWRHATGEGWGEVILTAIDESVIVLCISPVSISFFWKITAAVPFEWPLASKWRVIEMMGPTVWLNNS